MDLIKLLNSLTLEEKLGQLTQISPYFFLKDTKTEIAGPAAYLGLNEDQIFLAGSVLGIGSASEMIEVQQKYLARSRHKIPLMFMADVIHGYETIFPVPLGLSTSWNPNLAKIGAEIAAKEASTSGISVTFAPMADLTRDPRWGRVVEGFGEDKKLLGDFVEASVKGFQGNDLKDIGSVASTIKHFAAYGAAEAGRDYNTVDMSKLTLHGTYLPAYKRGVDAGARLVMTAFNVVDGIPSTTNPYLLKDVLRNSWKFNGVTITDYNSLRETINHGTSANGYDAAVQGLNATLDIEMASSFYMNYLKKALDQGDVNIKDIDAAVLRVLQLKKDLGLFEDPYKGASILREQEIVRHQSHLDEALKAAHESIVLLKNNHQIFPLKKKMKVALIGRYAFRKSVIGPWSWHGGKHQDASLYDVLKDELEIVYASENLEIDLVTLQHADVVLVAAGEEPNQSGEAHSRTNLNLPFDQETLIKRLKGLNKPVGLILFNGRPLVLSDIEPYVDGILEAFFPGSMGNHAIKDILLGYVNPSGKLTMSFPRNVGQIPIYYNALNTGRPVQGAIDHYTSHYLDSPNDPLYPFGFGLSYSEFKYHNLKLSHEQLPLNQTLTIMIDVENTTETAGYEIIQVYMRDHTAKVSRPLKELVAYRKVWFKPHERKTITFDLNAMDLSYVSHDLTTRIEEGIMTIFAGSSSVDVLSKTFELVKE